MDVIDAIHGRRSIRSYAATPVERDILESIIFDAAQAPPPLSAEVPWTFNVVQGVETNCCARNGRNELCEGPPSSR